jgi:hypothetical protein
MISLDNVALIITAVSAIVAAYFSYRATRKVETVHLLINSRMDELVRASEKAAHAAGMVEGAANVIAAKLNGDPA